MRRYEFLREESIFSALNRLRAALLAANDGNEVELIINAVLTQDERLKIGRRVEIAQRLLDGEGHEKICSELKVGKTTIAQVTSKLSKYPKAFELINIRLEKVDSEYKKKSRKTSGGSKLIFKKSEHTGFRRKDVER